MSTIWGKLVSQLFSYLQKHLLCKHDIVDIS